jgi:hypothetical protein
MKKLSLTLLTCLLFLSPNMVMSETLSDLVKREGLYYKKFTEVPFTGKITGKSQGSFKNGKKEGPWVHYWNEGNGQLFYKGNYKNGEREVAWVSYHYNGQLWNKGNYKNGEREGAWVEYKKDGTVNKWQTGIFKDGKKISD